MSSLNLKKVLLFFCFPSLSLSSSLILFSDCDQMALRLSGDSMNVLLYSSQKKVSSSLS